MAAKFRVIALSSLDIAGTDLRKEPELLYSDAIKAAQELKAQGKAFRVLSDGESSPEQIRTFKELGAID